MGESRRRAPSTSGSALRGHPPLRSRHRRPQSITARRRWSSAHRRRYRSLGRREAPRHHDRSRLCAPPADRGIQASVVDVPGHEAFVKTCSPGDRHRRRLLIIAADEGIMPQTEEHLAIVELLGVRRGIPVLTKRDLVDDEWLALVRTEVAERLSRSRMRWQAPIAVSALTGESLEDLKKALVEVAADLADRSADDLFRLPIDRVFALAGAGPSSPDRPGAAVSPPVLLCDCSRWIAKSACARFRYTATTPTTPALVVVPRSRWSASTKPSSSAAMSP